LLKLFDKLSSERLVFYQVNTGGNKMVIKISIIRSAGFVCLALLLAVLSNVQASAQSKMPDGSYKDTCRNMHMLVDIMTAQCQNDKGVWTNAKINLSFCEGDVRNDNGALKCKQKPAPSPPKGTYSESCRDVKVVGNELRASCQKKNGNWNNTRIKYKKCDRDIWNDNGELSCSKKSGSKLPKGSYKNTCKDAYTDGNKLYAKCENRNGKWKNTNINYKNCSGDISNDNGQLVCGGGQGKLPPGSYKNSCKNIYKEGNMLEADCKNKNGKWKHSSIKFKNCKNGLWNDNGRLSCN
jgi:major membrane immunogen (membrane-anchored lipoprotein)